MREVPLGRWSVTTGSNPVAWAKSTNLITARFDHLTDVIIHAYCFWRPAPLNVPLQFGLSHLWDGFAICPGRIGNPSYSLGARFAIRRCCSYEPAPSKGTPLM